MDVHRLVAKTKNTLRLICSVGRVALQIVGVTAVILASGYGGWSLRGMQSEAPREAPLRTIEEVQRLVGCAKIDGKLGPETQRLWDRAICNQYAKEYQQ